MKRYLLVLLFGFILIFIWKKYLIPSFIFESIHIKYRPIISFLVSYFSTLLICFYIIRPFAIMLIIPVQLIVFFILLFIPYHLSERIEKWIDGSYILVALSLLSLFLFEYLIKQFGRQPDATDINSGL
jgi:hypothetical protein